MKKTKRVLSMVLALVMVLGLAPFTISQPAAAGNNGCIKVEVGTGTIGNKDYGYTNLMDNFGNKGGEPRAPGFRMEKDNPYTRYGGNMRMDNGHKCIFIVTPAENETLAALAQPGSGAQYRVEWRAKCQKDHHEWHGHNDYELTHIQVYETKGSTETKITSGRAECDGEKNHYGNSGWLSFEGVTELYMNVYCDRTCNNGVGGEAEAELWFYIRDKQNPTMTYEFTTNGTENLNSNKSYKDSNNELLIKLGTANEDDPDLRYAGTSLTDQTRNYVDMKVTFSEPLKVEDAAVSTAAAKITYPEGSELTVQDYDDAVTKAVETYETENATLKQKEETLASKTAPEDLEACQTTVAGALQALRNSSTVKVTSTSDGQGGTTKTYSIVNPYQTAVAQGNFTTLFEALAGSDTYEQTMPEDATGDSTAFTLPALDGSYIKDATAAILKAQTDALDAMTEQEKEALEDGSPFHADDEQAKALAAIAALMSNATSAEKAKVTSPAQTQSEQEGGNTVNDDRLTCGVKALYAWRTEKEFTEYANAKKAYDDQKVIVDNANAAIDAARQKYNEAASYARNVAMGESDLTPLVRHELFTNTLGTGYLRMGLPCNLELYRGSTLEKNKSNKYVLSDLIATGYGYTDTDSSSDKRPNVEVDSGLNLLTKYSKTLNWRYSAQRGDYFGNNPIPGGGYIEKGATNITSLMQKINDAKFYDAAGNPLNLVSSSGNWKNKKDSSDCGVNIFDIADSSGSKRGYDVIVDAEPPTYTRTGNGISPDILTQVIVNKNDSFDFIVSFSEGTYTNREFSGGDAKTYLLLNNGDRAYFKSKDSGKGKTWTFHYDLTKKPDGTTRTEEELKAIETSQLLVIGLCNDALDKKLNTDAPGSINTRTNIAQVSYNADARTITDYVGNVMADRANENALTNKNQIESDTSWAGITVDNTEPEISFSYLPYTATMQRSSANADGTVTDVDNPWGQAAKVLVTAVDPQIATPKYNPDQSVAVRSTKGIFRPDNASSASSSETSASGLIYYLWTPSDMAADVAANFAGTNYEVIKRFSLAGWDQTAVNEMNKTAQATRSDTVYSQWAELYNYFKDEGGTGLRLSMANNGSQILPPEELITGDYSGKWTLHVWTADMSWDSARQLMQYQMMYDRKFNSGYNPTSAVTKKMEMIQADFEANNKDKDSKYTYDDARNAVESNTALVPVKDTNGNITGTTKAANYLTTVYTQNYINLLEKYVANNPSKTVYSDDAELFARNQTMKDVGNYGNLSIWGWDKFNQDDSNWTYQRAEVWFDNTKPVIAADQANVVGNNTKSVKAPFTVTDAHSGADTAKVYYQWVKLPEDAGEVTSRPESTKTTNGVWEEVTPDSKAEDGKSATFSAVTQDILNEDGVYYLTVKASDRAGNEIVEHTEVCVTVQLDMSTDCVFGQIEEKAEYYQSVTPTFHVVADLAIESVEYAVTDSGVMPDDSAYNMAINVKETVSASDKTYQIPALSGEQYADGTWYVHVRVAVDAAEQMDPFEFYGTYQLDNTAPTLYLNPDGSGLAKESASATVTATDARSGVDANTLYYIWTTSEDTPAVDADWEPVVSGEAVTKKISDASENGSYYLHAKVADNIGNAATACSKAFVLEVEVPEVVASYASGLLTVYAEDEEFYGIATLDLEADEKSGYRYSFSSDGGTSWSSWLPYSSMAKLKLPIKAAAEAANLAGKLQVKFRAPGGTVGEPLSIAVDGLDANDQLWAVMTVESLVPRSSGDLTLLVEKPEGVTVTSESLTADEAGDFKVTENGLYSFTLTDGTGSKDYVIVVDVYDKEKPNGVVNLSETAPTSANVIATLETDEAVYVKEIHFTPEGGSKVVRSGSPTYTVEENGTVEFLFADAAGNESSASAAVKNIDRSAPEVKIAVTYTSGSGKSYASWQYGGQTLSQGAFLTVVSLPGSKKSFEVVSGDLSGTTEVTENGTYSFTVQDSLGNVGKASITFGKGENYAIAEKIGDPEVKFSFTAKPDSAVGAAELAGLVPGEVYKNAYVTAKVLIPAPTDGREIYFGREKATGAEPLAQEDGYYVYTKTYQANCETSLWFNDGHGGTIKVPVKVTGIDTTRPTLTLNQPTVVVKVDKNKPTASYDLMELGGGYTVTDGDRSAEGATVEVRDLYGAPMKITGSTTPGAYTAQYYVRDSAGNENFTEQTVYVIDANDLFIQADNALLANNASNTAILATNRVTFMVSEKEMQQMFYRDQRAYNRDMRYDVYYTTGLYREGQLKYIAEKLTGEELIARNFTVTFAKTGWYTIIIRNQERSRVYTSFFVSSMEG